jgi:hypothetical protein
MNPVNGSLYYSSLQKHAADRFFNTNTKYIAYETKQCEEGTSLFHGMIVNMFLNKFKGRILFFSATLAPPMVEELHAHAIILGMIQKTGVFIKHVNGQSIFSDTTQVNCSHVSVLLYNIFSFIGYDVILIDAQTFEINTTLRNMLHNIRNPNRRLFITYSGKPPLQGEFISSQVCYYTQDYFKSTRRAMYAWILCAKKLSIHRNIIYLIAQWIASTRHDTCWIRVEYEN